jgi:hypothetical protein
MGSVGRSHSGIDIGAIGGCCSFGSGSLLRTILFQMLYVFFWSGTPRENSARSAHVSR